MQAEQNKLVQIQALQDQLELARVQVERHKQSSEIVSQMIQEGAGRINGEGNFELIPDYKALGLQSQASASLE